MTLQQYLKTQGMTQRELSKKLKISPPHMNNILKGRRNITRHIGVRIMEVSGDRIMVGDLWPELRRTRK